MRATQARFAAYGAQPEQLEFRGHSKGADYLREFQDIDLALDPSPAVGGTTTHDALSNGVPVLALHQDASRYFDYHHTADDTLAIVDPVQLRQNVAAWAATLYMIADSDVDFRAVQSASK